MPAEIAGSTRLAIQLYSTRLIFTQVAVSRFLLAHGADPELSTADGTTPFSVVRQKQIPGIGELFDVLLLARLAVKCRGCDHHHGTARHRFIDDRNLTRAVAAFLKTSAR